MLNFILVSLVFVIVYVLYQIYDYKKSMKQAKQIQTNIEQKEETDQQINPNPLDLSQLKLMTIQDLHKNNGQNNSKVYVSIKNIVFDVSSSESYRPDGSYGAFAGQDISISLGKMDLSSTYLNKYGTINQPEDEVGNMNSWFSYFYQRYPVVGKIQDKKND